MNGISSLRVTSGPSTSATSFTRLSALRRISWSEESKSSCSNCRGEVPPRSSEMNTSREAILQAYQARCEQALSTLGSQAQVVVEIETRSGRDQEKHNNSSIRLGPQLHHIFLSFKRAHHAPIVDSEGGDITASCPALHKTQNGPKLTRVPNPARQLPSHGVSVCNEYFLIFYFLFLLT